MTKASKTKLEDFEESALHAGYERNEGVGNSVEQAEVDLEKSKNALIKRIEKLEADRKSLKNELKDYERFLL